MSQTGNNEQYEKLTGTPIPQLVVSLAIPAVMSMMVTSIYNMADTAFVGTIGTSASGAVGIVFGFMAILQACAFMFGQGAGSILSRLQGQKKLEEASRYASTGFFMAVFLATVIAVFSFLFLDQLVMLLGSTKTIAPYAKTYISFILATAPFTVGSFVMNNLLRYEGKALLGMMGIMTGSILNIFGDAFLILGLGMGVEGAGLSTAVGQIISFGILLSMFLRGKTTSHLSIKNVMFSPKPIMEIVTTGFPSLVRQGLVSIGTMMLNSASGVYGDAAVAAMSIVTRIMMFVFSIGLGIGQGFQPVSAFNYGAKKYKRLRSAFSFGCILAEVLVFSLSAIVFLGSGSIIKIFRNDPQVIAMGIRPLRLQCLTILLLPPCMITEMMMQSTGKRLAASILSALRNGLFFIPALVVLAHYRGLTGIQEAQPLAYILSCIPSAICLAWYMKNLPKEDL